MKNLKSIAVILASAALLLLPGCRKSFNITDDKIETGTPTTIDPDDEGDDVSTFEGAYVISVVYSGSSATWSITDSLGAEVAKPDSISVTVSGAGVTVNNQGSYTVKYVLSGTSSAGFFKLYSNRRQEIELSNLSLTGSSGAAINNQSDKRTYIVLTGRNTVKDGGTYGTTLLSDGTAEDCRGAFFSEGQLCISGTGSLDITASAADGKGGLFSDDYIRFLGGTVSVTASKGHAIRGKDAVIVSDGSVSASCSADGKKAVTTDGFFQQDGGSLTASSTGAAIYNSTDKDLDGTAGLKCDTDFTMNGGSLTATASGAGGKGISIGGAAKFNGGRISATATGSNRYYVSSKYSDSSSPNERYKSYPHSYPKAIKCDGAITVQGAAYVYGKSASHEGITTDGTWTQDGGTVIAESYDDAVNSAKVLTVNDGYLRGTSVNNDGIDANAAIYINGGVVIGEGKSSPECGIDSVEGTTVTVSGGFVVSRGGGLNSFTSSGGTAFVQTTTSAGTRYGLMNGNTPLMAYQAPSSGGTTTMFCAPGLKSGSSYTLYTGVTISQASEDFPRFGESFSGGSSGSSLSATSSISGSMGGGGGGGRPPGGGW